MQAESLAIETVNDGVKNYINKMQKRINEKPSISFKLAKLESGPLPFSIYNSIANVDLKGGLLHVDYFQTDILGGSVIGSFSLPYDGKYFFINGSIIMVK